MPNSKFKNHETSMLNIQLQNQRILEALSNYEPITLKNLDSVRLMNRQDTKMVIKTEQLPDVLRMLDKDYFVLEIDGRRISSYESLYYDYATLGLYMRHHNGRSNRYKIRFRKYIESNISFLEVKFKSNKKRTIKKRIQTDDIEYNLKPKSIEFLKEMTPLDVEKLEPSVLIFYRRITLANKDLTERVTIDVNLSFQNYYLREVVEHPDMAIIEVKQERFNRKSPAVQALHQSKVYPIRLSKYCLGVMTCLDSIKRNQFKKKMLQLAKITQNDVYRNIASIDSRNRVA